MTTRMPTCNRCLEGHPRRRKHCRIRLINARLLRHRCRVATCSCSPCRRHRRRKALALPCCAHFCDGLIECERWLMGARGGCALRHEPRFNPEALALRGVALAHWIKWPEVSILMHLQSNTTCCQRGA